MTPNYHDPLKVFISYSHKDDDLREELDIHLSNLKRQGKIAAWHDKDIEAGEEWKTQIDSKLESAQIILLLVSPPFMASDYCYNYEMKSSIVRHNEGTARVIPIILRPCDWKEAPFSKLQVLPKDAKPVTQWANRDEAFLDIVEGIRGVVESLGKQIDGSSSEHSPLPQKSERLGQEVSSFIPVNAKLSLLEEQNLSQRLLTRRSVLRLLLGTTILTTIEINYGSVLQKVLAELGIGREKGRIHQALSPPQGTIYPDDVKKRYSLAFELFLSSEVSITEFIPPQTWDHALPDIDLGNGQKTYEHEYWVLEAITGLMSSSVKTWDTHQESWLAHANSSMVMLASGKSNEASRWLIGEPDSPIWSPRVGDRTIDLSYSIKTVNGYAKRLQYGEEIERQLMAVCDRRGNILVQAQTNDGWQMDDYLLVTRVPGPSIGTVITVISGLHGPGTRSAVMLLNPKPNNHLEELASRIGHKSGEVPYYQAVFRSSDFRNIGGSSVASSIELLTEVCPPVRIA